MAIRFNRRRQAKTDRIAREWARIGESAFTALGVTREQLARFEHELVGRIVLPGMPDYDACRDATGLCPFVSSPRIIVYCAVPNDVRLCLAWSHVHGWWVTCRSGGHSTAGYCVNDGVVIDVSEMNYVSVDPRLKQARVGAGTTFHELNSVLDTYRLHVPGGTCPDVGVAGYMQGGGYGLTSLMFGMNCDSVIEVTVMLADGRIVLANSDTNADLFWAIRGGTGNNFGVLLEAVYSLVELDDLWGFCLQWPLEDAPAALLELQNSYTRDAMPAGLGYEPAFVVADGTPVFAIPGMFAGDRSAGLDALRSLLRTGRPAIRIDKRGSYADLNESLLEALTEIPAGTREVKQGGYVGSPLQLADWERVVRYFATSPTPYNMAVIEPYGGAISRHPASANAFVHRQPYMDFFVDSFYGNPGDLNKAQEWLNGFMELMQPFFNGHMYQNYPIRDFADFRWAYWGDAFNSLLFVKQKYDPENFFHFEQSISPYPAEPSEVGRSSVPSMFDDKTIVCTTG